jgi:hypothetical protein
MKSLKKLKFYIWPASSPGANKKFHTSHYMKGLHEVVRRDEHQNAHIPLPFARL